MSGEALRKDAELVAGAHEEAALRLQLGQVLLVMSQKACCFQLGFSSLAAYALERCERSGRWAEDSLGLARRLERLPAVRRALALGELSWSKAELVARAAEPADQAYWLELAHGHTVRQLRPLVQAAREQARSQSKNEEAEGGEEEMGDTPPRHSAEPLSPPGEEAPCTLTCTVHREDAWLFEATQKLLDQLGTHGSEAQVEALLAEGQDTLLAGLSQGSIDPDVVDGAAAAQLRWRQQLRRWQSEAEERCEAHFVSGAGARAPASETGVSGAAAAGCAALEGLGAGELDALARRSSLALVRHDFELSRAVLAFHRADGWRQLGYATESQYACERLGWSRSLMAARRALAARLEGLPAVAQALAAAQIGVEAALQLVRVATPRTELAWVERARQRTLKHLREEVAAALTAVRISGERDCPPPEAPELEAFGALERAVVSGEACRPPAPPSEAPARGARPFAEPESASRRAWLVMLGELLEWLEQGVSSSIQMSGGSRSVASAGRVELRLRVSRELFTWWRTLEAQARRWLPAGMSWVKFLCLCVWRAWRHVLGARGKYGDIFLRDAYRCQSPVCTRKDVTPHHLRFRSRGGGDEAQNLASVCTWCHLFGIHGGRIRAEGTADCIHWELGPAGHPCVVVHGRERRAA